MITLPTTADTASAAPVIATPLAVFARFAAKFTAKAEETALTTPCIAAYCASVLMEINFGKAVAAKIPKMTITITSSIRVNPL